MIDIYQVIRLVIIASLLIVCILSIIAVSLIEKKPQQCLGQNPTQADIIANNYYFLFSSSEITFYAVLSSFSTLTLLLAFLVGVNNFKVLSILVAIALLSISAVVLANLVSLSNDPNPQIKNQYAITSGITVPLLYASMIISIIACVGTCAYYGQNFVKDLRHLI